MTYVPITDLKKPRLLREALASEGQLVITRDGTPFAVMVGITAGGVEAALRELRRAMFSAAVDRAREKARKAPITAAEIERTVAEVRRERRRR